MTPTPIRPDREAKPLTTALREAIEAVEARQQTVMRAKADLREAVERLEILWEMASDEAQ